MIFDLEAELNKRLPNCEDKTDYVINEFKNILKELNINFNELKYLSKGESSIVYEYNDKIIKLTTIDWKVPLKEYISNSSAILPIDYEKEINFGGFYKYFVIISKKLKTGTITGKDVVNIYNRLRIDGYLWEDTRKENLGKDENGNIFLFDYGELVNLNICDISTCNAHIKHHDVRKKEYVKKYRKFLAQNEEEPKKIKSFFKRKEKNS